MLQLRFILISLGAAIGLFLSLLLFIEIGRHLGQRRIRKVGGLSSGGVVENSVYGLLALLIGFTFSGAAARFDHRREMVGDEANAASTSWQRIELLPSTRQEPIRDGLRHYLDAVIDWYKMPASLDAAVNQPAAVTRAQDVVWRQSVEACLTSGGEVARMLLLPALNELFDAVDRERMARRIHPPAIVWLMLAITALASALFVGYGFAGSPRNWLYITGFAASISVATYVIVELEYPRLGLTSAAAIDRALVELRASLE